MRTYEAAFSRRFLKSPMEYTFATDEDGLPLEFAGNIRRYQGYLDRKVRFPNEYRFSVQDLILLCQYHNTRIHRGDPAPSASFFRDERERIRSFGADLAESVRRIEASVEV